MHGSVWHTVWGATAKGRWVWQDSNGACRRRAASVQRWDGSVTTDRIGLSAAHQLSAALVRKNWFLASRLLTASGTGSTSRIPKLSAVAYGLTPPAPGGRSTPDRHSNIPSSQTLKLQPLPAFVTPRHAWSRVAARLRPHKTLDFIRLARCHGSRGVKVSPSPRNPNPPRSPCRLKFEVQGSTFNHSLPTPLPTRPGLTPGPAGIG